MHDGSTLLRIEAVEKGMRRRGGHLSRLGAGTDKGGDRREGATAAHPLYQGELTGQMYRFGGDLGLSAVS